MLGFFKVKGFTGSPDQAGYRRQARVESAMEPGIEATLYLPPYLRKAQCAISEGSTVYGVADDTTGIGVALFGEDCDFGYFLDADLAVGKGIAVADDVVAGDGQVSLTSHWHGYIDTKGAQAVSTPSKTEKPDTPAVVPA